MSRTVVVDEAAVEEAEAQARYYRERAGEDVALRSRSRRGFSGRDRVPSSAIERTLGPSEHLGNLLPWRAPKTTCQSYSSFRWKIARHAAKLLLDSLDQDE
jgi:hypothetical protein